MTERLAADAAGIFRAAQLLRDGALVAFGTETVYGLGADATNASAVAAVFAAKGRPSFNPLICHYADAEAAFSDVVPNAAACAIAKKFWPGPLTLVLPRRGDSQVALLTGAGLDTLAVRVPAHPLASALLRAVGRPVAAPSANRSGSISPTTAAHVLDGLGGRIAAVLDCGPCPVGVESTVLDLSGPHPILLRPGGVPREALAGVLAFPEPPPLAGGGWGRGGTASPTGDTPPPSPFPHGEGMFVLRSPGMLNSHYAPSLPVRLDATTVAADEALLAFGPPLPGAAITAQLSATGGPQEAAANLFAALRELDAAGGRLGLRGIAAMPVPDAGLGLAINDRLRRAAAPRG